MLNIPHQTNKNKKRNARLSASSKIDFEKKKKNPNNIHIIGVNVTEKMNRVGPFVLKLDALGCDLYGPKMEERERR